MSAPLLSVRDLTVGFATENGLRQAVEGVSFDVQPQQTLGIVGESGCGKSVTAFSILRLLPQPMGNILHGEILFDGQDLRQLPQSKMASIRGRRISMIFQEPMTALNPVHRIGRQMAECLSLHQPLSRQEASKRCVQLLGDVGIPSPELRCLEYPHQLSGGMRQRVLIAMALANQPELIIADEPTTALDVTVQAQILQLLKDLQERHSLSLILITHDLGVVAEMCDHVAVMYAGKIVESGTVYDLFEDPKHPYTLGLLQAMPCLDGLLKTPLATIPGTVPSLSNMPTGCRFANRCPYSQPACTIANPPMENVTSEHTVSCIRWQDIANISSPTCVTHYGRSPTPH